MIMTSYSVTSGLHFAENYVVQQQMPRLCGLKLPGTCHVFWLPEASDIANFFQIRCTSLLGFLWV